MLHLPSPVLHLPSPVLHLVCSVSRLERDVKQKRQLIESLKEKESSQQQLMEECRGKMVRGGGREKGEGR